MTASQPVKLARLPVSLLASQATMLDVDYGAPGCGTMRCGGGARSSLLRWPAGPASGSRRSRYCSRRRHRKRAALCLFDVFPFGTADREVVDEDTVLVIATDMAATTADATSFVTSLSRR